MAQTANTVFRDFTTDGVPSSGAHNPKKADIREWGAYVEQLHAAAQAGGGVVFQTKAAMTLGYAANQIAWVISDPTAANNGIYQKQGASGAGSWVRVGDLPYSFVSASNTGAGTANALAATTSIPVPQADGAALITVNIVADNTASPVTVSFNGDAPLTVKTNSGNDVAPGGLVAGMQMLGTISGATFRLVSDQASSAVVASAEAAAWRAEAAAASVEHPVSYAPQALTQAQQAQARTNINVGADIPIYPTAVGMTSVVVPGEAQAVRVNGHGASVDGGGALYKKVASQPPHSGKFQSADGAWWEITGDELSIEAFGAKAGEISDAQIQAAIDAGVAKSIYIPAKTYYVDNTIYVREGVTLRGERGKSILRAVGRDTHGRNSKVFDKLNGTTITLTAVVVMAGSHSVARNFLIDGNGRNNYYLDGANKVWWGTPSAFPNSQLGYAGVRIGWDYYGTAGNLPIFNNVVVDGVDTIYCARGGVCVFGEDQRKTAAGSASGEAVIGIDGALITNCRANFCHSNVYGIIGGQNITYRGNTVTNALHSGFKMYRNWRNCVFDGNRVLYEQSELLSWRDPETPDEFRENEFGVRTECISIGHDSSSGVAEGAIVVNNTVDGKGKLHRGICLYPPSDKILIANNRVTGIVRTVFLGPVGTVGFEGNHFEGLNYTNTTKSGTIQGDCLHLDTNVNPIDGKYTKTVATFSGNYFGGTVYNLVRKNSSAAWDSLGIGCFYNFHGNTFDIEKLTDFGGAAIAILVSSVPAAGGGFTFRGNSYINKTANLTAKTSTLFNAGTLVSPALIMTDLT